MKINKPIAKFTLVTQILFPLLFSATSVAAAANTKQEKASHREVLAKIQSNLPELTSKQTDETQSMTSDELLAQGLNKSAQIISADKRLDAVENLAQSTAYGFVSNQMTNWLNQYGNATIQISSDKAFSGEYFLPFYETEDNLFFSQSRIQRQNEDRTTLNLGLGYRYFMPNKMLGINSFYDRDLKNNHARLGLGAEFGADYIKLVTNGYFRLTDWRESRLSAFHDYDERAANGFDIKAEGFLPSYPQLGANIKYEKYFGDKVNLKGSNSISDLKKDPQAYTVGLSYTPVPLLSFSLNQSMGDVNETKGELAVNYRFGVPLSQQLDTDLVQQMRTLMGARYNPVDRNNTIVMQYQKQDLLRIGFEKTLYEVNSGDEETITPTIHSNKYNVKHVVYMSHDGLFGGKDTYTSKTADHSAKFTVPEFNSKSRSANNNIYEINAYAVDVNGNRSNTVKLNVQVVKNGGTPGDDGNETTDGKVDFKKSEFKASFGGKETSEESPELTVTVGDKVKFTVTLNNSNGSPVKGKAVSIINETSNATACEEKDTDENGVYRCEAESPDINGYYEYNFTVPGQKSELDNIKVTYNPINVEQSEVMLIVNGVEKNEVHLWESNEKAILYVKLRDKDGTPVTLKTLKGDNETEVSAEKANCEDSDRKDFDMMCKVNARYGSHIEAVGESGGSKTIITKVYAGRVGFGGMNGDLKEPNKGITLIVDVIEPYEPKALVEWQWSDLKVEKGERLHGHIFQTDSRHFVYFGTFSQRVGQFNWKFEDGDYCYLYVKDCYSY